MVNVIKEDWWRSLKAQCVLLSCCVSLCGAVEILKIPSLGGFEACVVSVLSAQGCWEGRLNVFFFYFQILKLTSDMQKRMRKCYSYKEPI